MPGRPRAASGPGRSSPALVRRARPRRDRRREPGDADGQVAWRVEVELSSDPAFADQPYRKTRYSTKPTRETPAGTRATSTSTPSTRRSATPTMRETFGYAFGREAARLDFITLTDYVGDSAWGEIGRYKTDYPGSSSSAPRRSSPTAATRTTSSRAATSTTAPAPSTSARRRRLTLLRAARAAEPDLRDVPPRGRLHADQPPDDLPVVEPAVRAALPRLPVGLLRRGDRLQAGRRDRGQHRPAEIGDGARTRSRPTAIDFYEQALAGGAHAPRVGASDSHNAGRADDRATQSPVGIGATAVYAKQLSERGIRCAVKAGHTYAKIGGPSGPDLRFTGRVPGARKRAIFGDAARGRSLKLAAKATGGGVLQLLRDGTVIATGSGSIARTVTDSGRYGLRLVDGQVTEAVGTPIWFRAAKRGRITVARLLSTDPSAGRDPPPPQRVGTVSPAISGVNDSHPAISPRPRHRTTPEQQRNGPETPPPPPRPPLTFAARPARSASAASRTRRGSPRAGSPCPGAS